MLARYQNDEFKIAQRISTTHTDLFLIFLTIYPWNWSWSDFEANVPMVCTIGYACYESLWPSLGGRMKLLLCDRPAATSHASTIGRSTEYHISRGNLELPNRSAGYDDMNGILEFTIARLKWIKTLIYTCIKVPTGKMEMVYFVNEKRAWTWRCQRYGLLPCAWE